MSYQIYAHYEYIKIVWEKHWKDILTINWFIRVLPFFHPFSELWLYYFYLLKNICLKLLRKYAIIGKPDWQEIKCRELGKGSKVQ